MYKKILAVTLSAAILAACSQEEEAEPPTETPKIAIDEPSAPLEDTPTSDEQTPEEDISQDPSEDAHEEPIVVEKDEDLPTHGEDVGHGTLGFPGVPEGMTEDQWRSEYDQAIKVAERYYEIRNRWDSFTSTTWPERTAEYSTPEQNQRDLEYVDSFEWHRSMRQFEEAEGQCEGNAWVYDGWMIDLEPATATEFTFAFPQRQECVWGPEGSPERRSRELEYQRSTGLGGFEVRMLAVRMKKIDGEWKVDQYDHVFVPEVFSD